MLVNKFCITRSWTQCALGCLDVEEPPGLWLAEVDIHPGHLVDKLQGMHSTRLQQRVSTHSGSSNGQLGSGDSPTGAWQ